MKRSFCRSVLTLLLAASLMFFLSNGLAFAVPARGEMEELVQPSGQKFKAALHGDEWFNWNTAETGEIIVKDSDGYWKYGQLAADGLKPGTARYKIDFKPDKSVKAEQLANWKKDRDSKSVQRQWMPLGAPLAAQQLLPAAGASLEAEIGLETQGNPGQAPVGPFTPAPASPQKILVLLVNFTNVTIQNSDAAWSNAIFGASGNTVNNYYDEVSGGNFSFSPAAESSGSSNDGIIRVTLNYAHPNTGSNTGTANQQIVANALTAANPFINFASFDNNANGYISASELHIITIVAGYERSYSSSYTPNVWAHQWSLSTPVSLDGKTLGSYTNGGGYTQIGEMHGTHMATIGVICHELGHDLGLPDLYDYDSSSLGVGIHSLMAGGSWGYTGVNHSGSSPTEFDPWSKIYLGFVTPTTAGSSGDYTVKSTATGQYNVLKVPTSNPKQYFLVENRQFSGYDAALQNRCASSGVAVWHIDEQVLTDTNWYGVNNNEAHKAVDLEEANQGSLGLSQLDTKAAGNYNHYYAFGGFSVFGKASVPNSSLYDGSVTNVAITAASASSPTMTVNVSNGDANLSNLAVSAGTLSPSFSADTQNYVMNVAYAVSSSNVTANLSDAGAGMTINGQVAADGVPKAISLSEGTNLIIIVVTARGGSEQKTYTITVTRAANLVAGADGRVIYVPLSNNQAIPEMVAKHGWTVKAGEGNKLKVKNVESVEIQNNRAVIKMKKDNYILKNETLQVIYKKPGDSDKVLRDDNGNMADFVASVDNNSKLEPPEINLSASTVSSDGVAVIVYFNGTLDTNRLSGINLTRNHGWTVKKAVVNKATYAAVKITSVDVFDNWVVLNVYNDPKYVIAQTDKVKVSYKVPADADKRIKGLNGVFIDARKEEQIGV